MGLVGKLAGSDVKFAKKGKDLASSSLKDSDLVFRFGAGVQQGAPYVTGLTPVVNKNTTYTQSIGKAFTGWPLVLVVRLAGGSGSNVTKGGLFENHWIWYLPSNPSNLVIRNNGDPSKFAYVIFDARIG